MDNTIASSHYLRWMALTAFLLFSVVAGFNAAVDPYGIFGTPRIEGFNKLKPRAAERVRVAKPYMAEDVHARTIVSGNSRPEMGINPESPCWDPAHQPVFNTAIPGASVRMQTEYARHAAIATGAKKIYFAVDFLDFLVDTRNTRERIAWEHPTTTDAARLRSEPDQRKTLDFIAQRAEDRFNALLSLETLVDAVVTVASQHRPLGPTRRANGFNPAHEYLSIIRAEGQAVLFEQKNKELAEMFGNRHLGLFNTHEGGSEPLVAFSRFLGWAQDNGITIQPFINPYHAHYLTMIELSGKWPLFEQWKREIATITVAQGATVWDFSGYDHYSTENPPPAGNTRDRLEWFWEPAHYNQELGDLILARLDRTLCAPAKGTGTFGTRLTASSIDRHLQDQRQAQQDYQRSNPVLYSNLSRLVAEQ